MYNYREREGEWKFIITFWYRNILFVYKRVIVINKGGYIINFFFF